LRFEIRLTAPENRLTEQEPPTGAGRHATSPFSRAFPLPTTRPARYAE
jgi:hypothetical protein